MPLTLWTEHGPGYRGPAFFARLASSLTSTENPTLYCVPNAAWKTRAEALCLPHCDGILFGERIVTTHHWLEHLAGMTAPCISPLMRNQRIAQLMQELPLDYFRGGKAADMVGDGIVAAFEAGILPDELTALAADFGQEREHDLAMVYEAYLQYLSQAHRVDPAQYPMRAAEALSRHCPLVHSRIIIDLGNDPVAILWTIVRALAAHTAAPDLHVIIPEALQHEAEGQLGVAARCISAEEWVATSPAPPALYRAPNLSAEYQWAAQHLKTLLSSGEAPATIAVVACNPDSTFWNEACVSAAILPAHAPEHALAASPISAPFHSDEMWQDAPNATTISDWTQWWKARMAPADRVQTLTRQLAHSIHAARTLQDIAEWDDIWLRCRAIVPAEKKLTQRDLQALIAPMLQVNAGRIDTSRAYTDITLQSHIGDRITHLVVLDATQDLLPRMAPSPFFKLAASFPQDPNAQRLTAAFPNSEKQIHTQMAAWQRLCGCAQTVTGIYPQSSDSRGEVFASLFFEATACDLPTSPTPISKNDAPNLRQFLNNADTIAHLRHQLHDHVFSITELEMFAECPFSHFARYILGINIPDEDSPEIPARDEGQIIHRLLEHYYRAPVADLAGMSDDDRRNVIHDRLTTLLAHDIRTATPLHQIQINRLLTLGTAVIVHDFDEMKRQGLDALQPTHLEWKFGYEDIPPLILNDTNGQQTLLRGKVDRIDTHPTQKKLLLMDYKTRTDPIVGEIQKGRHLQIPLYLMAVQKLFSDHILLGGLLYDLPKLERRHGMVRKEDAEFLGIPGRPKSLVKPETWETLLETAAAHAVHYAGQIRGAEVPIPTHNCEYCDWKDLLPWEYHD